LRSIIDNMLNKSEHDFDAAEFRDQMENHGHGLGELPGWMFGNLLLYMDNGSNTPANGLPSEQSVSFRLAALRFLQASNTARFSGAKITADITDEGITHVVVGEDRDRLRGLRERLSTRTRQPRIVTLDWIEQSWAEKTLLDEERFAPY